MHQLLLMYLQRSKESISVLDNVHLMQASFEKGEICDGRKIRARAASVHTMPEQFGNGRKFDCKKLDWKTLMPKKFAYWAGEDFVVPPTGKNALAEGLQKLFQELL